MRYMSKNGRNIAKHQTASVSTTFSERLRTQSTSKRQSRRPNGIINAEFCEQHCEQHKGSKR